MKSAVSELRGALARLRAGDKELQYIVSARDEVLARFQKVFNPSNLSDLTEEDFRDFLLFRNNRHWQGLHRKGPQICADMNRLRDALAILLDESHLIRERLDKLVSQGGGASVPGLGRGVLTPLLLISYPDRYAVWNSVSEAAMKKTGIWPEFERGLSFGERYERVNAVQLRIAQEIGVDLWTLDALWWRVDKPTDDDGDGNNGTQLFGLERHLHEFLRDNWDNTSLGKDWAIYLEDGDLAGYEYPCGIGRIDILAKHRAEPRWLVIELKRDQSSDTTVGQVLRYIGWVRKHMAQKNESVQGLVICREADDSIWYALNCTPDVEVQLYKVDFKLFPAPSPMRNEK